MEMGFFGKRLFGKNKKEARAAAGPEAETEAAAEAERQAARQAQSEKRPADREAEAAEVAAQAQSEPTIELSYHPPRSSSLQPHPYPQP